MFTRKLSFSLRASTRDVALVTLGSVRFLDGRAWSLSGSIPQHLENIPDLQRFTVWGNNAMTRRYTTQEVEGDNLGTILSVEVYESQARRRPLPDLKFF